MKRLELLYNRDFVPLVIASLLVFVLVVIAVYRQLNPEWLTYQKSFKELLRKHVSQEVSDNYAIGIKQIWIPELRRVDRCITCHVGYEWSAKLLGDLPEPYRAHPELSYLEKHRLQNFGCTLCHGGQGYATKKRDAHEDPHWEYPLLSNQLASKYGLTPAELIQINCNQCHRRDTEREGMELINLAKRLIREKNCTSCHIIDGKGGLIGPELTYVGNKNPEFFDFSHLEGEKNVLAWHIEHFKNPQTLIPSSTMPNFNFNSKEAVALALLMLSFTREPLPGEYIPKLKEEKAALPEVKATAIAPKTEVSSHDLVKQGEQVYREKGCNSCHSVGGGVLLGPDLAGIKDRRSREWLKSWLEDPQKVLESDPALASWPEEFGGIVMPNQGLTDKEIEALIKYMESF